MVRTSGAAYVRSAITEYKNGWFRCEITWTASQTLARPAAIGLQFDTVVTSGPSFVAGNNSDGIFVWGGQTEVGAFATSYIPTVASQVTRTADVANMTGTNFSDWFNPTEGTFTARAAQYHTAGASLGILSINGNADFPRMTFYRQAAGSINGFVKTTGATQAVLSCGVSQTVNTFWNQAQAYTQATSYYSVNAATPVSSNISLTGLTFTDMTFGNNFVGAGAYINGWIAKVNYYPQRLTNAELQAITK